MIDAAYEKLKKEASLHQEALSFLITYLRNKGFTCPNNSPIQPIYVSSKEKARATAAKLINAGFDVRAIVSPTVRKGQECLRLVLHSFNKTQEIDALENLLLEEALCLSL
jgi:8-amino-7-oxononanoate synthase